MKTIKQLSFVFALAIILTSCDAIGDLLTIKIKDVKMTKDVQIKVEAPMTSKSAVAAVTGYAFTNTAKVQVSETEDLKEYLSQIKEIVLDSITCKVYGVENGDVQSLKLTVNPLNFVKTIDPVIINEEIYIPFTDAEFKSIASQILDYEELEFKLEGVVSKRPLTFNISVTVDADYVVKILND